ncbi:ABC-type bacteriocin/lantibiotic exporter, contains an N-terminal double-glycine peptidase domain [Streptosporangium subroseum]|uniref:ABC-type bacteriocin/lantibiotic exporter, contains an N-terminal double-glycine peptidase domain n=1 Tax=Streptosporangium subroseum TaxID=106412 RepID=A0A239P500_9ACTN|nr:peptidase domain-containing ABC transporter [Streptosporangium subroseum]SNT62155.1 ABC-type bacteriocin/lantibiotic exporter, contains an N-terminal double-glycine peptidase domain [Streptosporangium subroseum]
MRGLRTGRRVPVIQQNGITECGAACLAMVLAYHGRRTSQHEITERLQVGRDGLSALAIVAGALEYKLKAKAFSLDPEDLARVPMPAIVHWQFDHFIVVERWGADRVDVVDPAHGRRRLTAEEFNEGFTGVLLAFEPGPRFSRGRSSAASAWRRQFIRTLLSRRRGLLAQVVAASLILQLLGLALPTLSEVLVDRVLPVGAGGIPAQATGLPAVLGAGLLLATVTQFAVGYLRSVLLLAIRGGADAELTRGVVSHLIALPYRYFALRGTGDLVTRANSVGVLRDMLTGQILSALLDGPLAIGYLILVFVRDPLFGACLVALAAAQIALLLITARRMRHLTQQELVAFAATQSRLMQAIDGIETLKASGAEERAVEQWSHHFSEQLNADIRSGLTQGLLDSALGAIRVLAPLGLMWVGTWRVLDGELTLGALVALNAMAVAALTPISSLMASLQSLQLAGAHFERLSDILTSEPEPSGGIEVLRVRGAVEMRNVSYRYDPRAPWTLRDVSLTIAPGQKVALVGPSGSGKSTLARLLLALHTPTTGEIRYDGVPLKELNLRTLRRQFGVVTQEPSLFTGSIRENIALNDPGASMDRIVRAARMADIHDEIETMPMGYETMLTEGNGLSGGQRQRLALARALLSRPKILLLDEATSNLDSESEAAIESHLAHLTQTRILIAHRLSTIRDANLILVVDGGHIVERGTHEQLLALGGRYAALVAAQTVGAAS